ncbi:MAG TPA: hypothetical protein VFT22_09040 [Kofleriaceae bacterium]|nr:hypothetical protein [Kofleriaceae bacterium]
MIPDLSDRELFKRISHMIPSQLVELIRLLNLNEEYISSILGEPSIIADQICRLAEQQYGEAWRSTLTLALGEVTTSGRNFLTEKVEHIRGFLVEPPQGLEIAPAHQGTVGELREALKKRAALEAPQLIRVRGTLFPAALLSSGWWERTRSQGFHIKWRSTLQQWLFDGFDQWAPSWDISWDLAHRDPPARPYYIAQLAQGDEADSIAVVFGPKRARDLRDRFIKGWKDRMWCGLEVEVTGVLGHKSQARKELSGIERLEAFNPQQASEYCIWLKDDEPKHDIAEVSDTDLYSGYLWKCLIPRQWVEERESKGQLIGLGDVYIVWEHTNFAASDAL